MRKDYPATLIEFNVLTLAFYFSVFVILAGSLQASVIEDAKILALDGADSDNFGYSVAVSGNLAIVGSYQDNDQGNISGSAYIYARTSGNTWVQQKKLTASDGAVGDEFGRSVAISGNLAIVGSGQDDDKGSNSGSAYIYANTTGNTWVEQAKITASDGAASDFFGGSVAISGNLAIVGSRNNDGSVGSAYIYVNTEGSTWLQQFKITASDGAVSDFFGYSVAISGNLAIVGSLQSDDVANDSGSAYIYANTTGNTWVEQAKINASDAAESDLFGVSVSISGNLAIVGSSRDDDVESDSGSAYIYANTTGNTWVEQAKINASDPGSSDYFGFSVSLSGNLAIVGSYRNDESGFGSGAAYIFLNTTGNTWFPYEKMTASDAGTFDSLGYSVAVSGNVFIAGSYLDDDNGSNSGSAYIKDHDYSSFISNPSLTFSVNQQELYRSPTTTATYSFSLSKIPSTTVSANLLMSGTASVLNGEEYTLTGTNILWSDNILTLTFPDGVQSQTVTLTPTYSGRYIGTKNMAMSILSGTGYTYSPTSETILIQDELPQKITAFDPSSNDNFGRSVAISGNLAIVGSPLDDDVANETGSAYIYARTSDNTWVLQTKVTASDASSNDNFGLSVAISDNLAIVGSYQDDDAGSNSGSAYIYANTTGNTWVQQAKVTASDASAGDNFGRSVAISGNLAIVGSYQDDDVASSSGSAYIYANTTGNTWVQQTKVVASDPVSFDYFGFSVAISGNLAIVGSYQDDDVASSSGSAYIYANTTGNTWALQTKVVASDPSSFDYFGYSVAISGNIAIVGSYQEDDEGSDSGAAYLYANTTGNTWLQQAKIKASDAESSDRFGYSVAISGNIAIVGSYQDDDIASSSGSAYIFANTTGNTWVEQGKNIVVDGASSDYFGYSVAISDGASVIGSYLDDDVGNSSGSAYFFAVASFTLPSLTMSSNVQELARRPTTSGVVTFSLSESLDDDLEVSVLLSGTASTGSEQDLSLSGNNVSLSGNVLTLTFPSGSQSESVTITSVNDGEYHGTKTLTLEVVASSQYSHPSETETISVQDVPPQRITALDGAQGDFFGWSVSVSDNLAIVGGPFDDDNGSSSGAAYVYANTSGTTWVQQIKLTPSDGVGADNFGYAVAISGNIAIVGSSNDDDDGNGSGSAYIFANTSGKTWAQQAKLTASDAASFDFFGVSVAISGNLVIVGSWQDDDVGINSGSAYIYANTTGNTWVEQTKLIASNGAISDKYGTAVALAGNLAMVGSTGGDGVVSDTGAAYVYANTSGNTWVEQSILMASDGAAGDQFGISVSLSGNLAAVGSYLDDDKGDNSGSTYIYANTSGNSWIQQTKLSASDGASNDYFGLSVSISGNHVLIGSYLDDDGGSGTGSAYVFANSSSNLWLEQSKLNPSDSVNFENFGYAVSLSRTTAFIGSTGYGGGGGEDAFGAATVFSIAETPSASLVTSDALSTETGTTTGTLALILSNPTTTDLTIQLSLSGNASRVYGTDFQLSGENVTWTTETELSVIIAAGSNLSTILLTPTDDALVEGLEELRFTIINGAGYLHTGDSGVISIEDDDLPALRILSSDVTATEEGTTTGNIVLIMDQPPVVMTQVHLVLGGTASTILGEDYNLDGSGVSWLGGTSANVTFPAGANLITLSLTPVDDVNTEDEETISITLDSGDGYNHQGDSAMISISDNDNTAPVISEGSMQSVTMSEDSSPASFGLTLNASDLERDTLTWTISSLASHGTANASGTGASKVIDYVPSTDFNGSDSFVVQVSDGAETDTITVNVTIQSVNDAPVISSVPSTLATAETAYTMNSTATDVDGDTLTWSLATAPTGMLISSTNGTITWTPMSGTATENENVVIRVSDGATSVTQSFTIQTTGLNQAPTIDQGNSLSFTLTEDGSLALSSANISVSDMENDVLTWTVSANATQGNVSSFVTGNNQISSLIYTPNPNYFGSDNFVLQVSDIFGGDSMIVELTITSVNDAPVVSTPSIQNLSPGDDFSLTLSTSDVDGDALTLRFLDASRSWVNISETTLNGTIPDFEAGQDLSFRMGVSDGTATSEVFVGFSIGALSEGGQSNISTSSTVITITDTEDLPIVGAKVQIFGQQLYYTDSEGKVVLMLSAQTSSVIEVSADGFLPSNLTIPAGITESSTSLETASLTLDGVVSLSDAGNPFGVVVAATSNLGTLETEVEGDGTYTLSLPQGNTTWTFGAGLDGYASSTTSIATNSENVALSQDFTLSKETQFSWKSNQDGPGDPVTIWITSNPDFATGDESTAQVSISTGSVSAVTFDEERTALVLTIMPAAEADNVDLEFSAQPSAGTLRNLRLNVALAQPGDEKQNLHFFQQLSHVAGTQGQITLTGLDDEEEDLSGLEVPAFGVSSNVEAIRMERVQEGLLRSSSGSPVYSVDAYLIDDVTGSLTLLGNDNIFEIYLTFSYDPDTWNPLRNQVLYSEDSGVTWQSIPQEDVVAVDPIRNTVTVRSEHLSLWTLTGFEGLFGNSGGPSGVGGGCLLR